VTIVDVLYLLPFEDQERVLKNAASALGEGGPLIVKAQERKQKVVDGLWKGLQGLMKSRKIKIFPGTGTLGPDHLVKIDDGTELQGTSIILAAGSVPRTIPGFDVDGQLVMTSDEVLALDRLPARAVVIGGGVGGCSILYHLAKLGWTDVVLVELEEGTRIVSNLCHIDPNDVTIGMPVQAYIGNHDGVALVPDPPVWETDGAELTRAFYMGYASQVRHHLYSHKLGNGDLVAVCSSSLAQSPRQARLGRWRAGAPSLAESLR